VDRKKGQAILSQPQILYKGK